MSTISEESEDLKTAREEEQVFGERLLDDLMNTFCDKLQKAAQEKNIVLDGLLAIQSITMEAGMMPPTFWQWVCCCRRLDAESVRRLVTGNRRVIQIIFDEDRIHYVVLYMNSQKKVFLYDSLGSGDIDSVLTKPVKQQIQTMFGHLFPGGEIPVNIEVSYEHQHDDWSCGYRAVACVTNLARSQNPVKHSYDLGAIYRFLVSVLNRPTCSWNDFNSAVFSKTDEPSETRLLKAWRFVQNSLFLTTSIFSNRSREEESSRVTVVVLRPDLSYIIVKGGDLLKEKSRTEKVDSTKTSASPSTRSDQSSRQTLTGDITSREHNI